MIPAIVLLAALQVAPSAQPARDIVAGALRAVEADSVRVAEARWRGAPSRDPRALLALASLARLTYRYADADRLYGALLTGSAVPTEFRLYARLGLGQSHAARWRYTDADPQLTAAAVQADSLGNREVQAEARLVLAALTGRRGMVDSTRGLILAAVRAAEGAGAATRARTTCTQAGLLRGSAARRADTLVTEGLRLARESGERRVIAGCLIGSALIGEVLGRQRSSIVLLEEAVPLLQAAHDRHALAAAYQLLAYTSGQYSANFWNGTRYAKAAILGGTQTGNVVAAAWARLNLAQIALRVGDLATARAETDSARPQLRALEDRGGVAALEFVSGEAALIAGDGVAARVAFQRADSIYGAVGFSNFRPGVWFRMAVAERMAGHPAEARRLLALATDSARAARLSGVLSDVEYELGLLLLEDGKLEEAAARFDGFAETMRQFGWHYRLDARARQAEALALAGKLAEAETVLDSSLFHLLSDRNETELLTGAGQPALLQARRFDFDPDLGLAVTVAAFARGGRAATALRIAEAWRTQELLANSARREALRSEIRPESAETWARALARHLMVSDQDLDATRRALPDSTVILYLVSGRRHEPGTRFLLTRDRIRTAPLPPGDSLAPLIARYSAALEASNDPHQLARELAHLVLGDSLGRAGAEGGRLLIIPDGPLHRLPFAALTLPDGRRLIERFAVSLAPSLRIATGTPDRATTTLSRAVLLGGPEYRMGGARHALPGALREVGVIAHLLPASIVLTGAEASRERLRASIGEGVSLLHLATHADVTDNGLLSSGIVLAQSGDQDGWLGVGQIAELPLDGALVVLSGCKTVGGMVLNGEGVQGLTTPFLLAGAQSLVASYWAVLDGATVPLMRDLYEGLVRGKPLSEALRAAQRASQARGEPPRLWAAFAVVGNGDYRLPAGMQRVIQGRSPSLRGADRR